MPENEVLRLAGSLDQGCPNIPWRMPSSPRRSRQQLELSTPEKFESASGIGVRGVVEGLTIALGNTALMEEDGVAWHALEPQAEALRLEGASVMFLGWTGRPASSRSPIRSSAPRRKP